MTTLIRLPGSYLPWKYALRVESVDADTFHRFIAALKENIAPRSRKWSADDRCWLLKESDTALYLLKHFQINYECDTAQDEPQPTKKLAPVEAYRTLFLQPGAPDFVIAAVYKALAKRLHPDAGGDVAAMQKVNQAMEALK